MEGNITTYNQILLNALEVYLDDINSYSKQTPEQLDYSFNIFTLTNPNAFHTFLLARPSQSLNI